jgi:hypothetical protein
MTRALTIEADQLTAPPSTESGTRGWMRQAITSRRGQLLLALGVALAVRVFLLVRAQGMLEGDEAILGVQAEDILRGAHPIYMYGQPYMASWETYLLAPLIAAFGPSGTLMHCVTLAESLLLVPLLGILAEKLYGERARLPAMLLAAVPPLYVAVVELHLWGGYVETLVLGTALLLTAVSIAERWEARAPTTRLWGLAGLLLGFAFWIDHISRRAGPGLQSWGERRPLGGASSRMAVAVWSAPSDHSAATRAV